MIPSIQPRPEASLFSRFREIDFIGLLLLIGIWVAGLMAISFGGLVYPWNSGQTIALFVVAGVLILAFLAQQSWSLGTTQERRAFPLQFFRNKSLCLVFVLECCASSLTYVPVYFIPLYFQFVRHDSAIMAGVRLLPLVIFLVVAIVVNGFVITANGRYMPWFAAGGALGLIGSALLYTVKVETSNAKLYGYSILIGTGAGCFLQLPFSVVQSLVPPESIPKAIGFVTFGQLGAPSVVLSVINAIFLNEASSNIGNAVSSLPRDTIVSILSGVGSDAFAGLGHGAQEQVLQFIVAGLNKAYIVTMTSGALALLLSIFLDKGPMFEEAKGTQAETRAGQPA